MATNARRGKNFLEHVIEAQKKHCFIRVSRGDKGIKASTCVITGHKTVWGEGQKKNEQFVYLPGIRLAGEYAAVQEYLKQKFNLAVAADAAANLKIMMSSMITIANRTSTAPIDAWYIVEETTTQGPKPVWKEYNPTSPKVMFDHEMAEYESFRKEGGSSKGSSAVESMDRILLTLNTWLSRAGLAEETLQRNVGGPKSKSKAAGTLLDQLTLKLNNLKGDQVILIGSDKKTADGYVLRTTKNVPKEVGVRLSQDIKNIYYRIYFKMEGNRIPNYVVTFLGNLGLTQEQITTFIGGSLSVSTAAGIALPTATPAQTVLPMTFAARPAPMNVPTLPGVASPPKFGGLPTATIILPVSAAMSPSTALPGLSPRNTSPAKSPSKSATKSPTRSALPSALPSSLPSSLPGMIPLPAVPQGTAPFGVGPGQLPGQLTWSPGRSAGGAADWLPSRSAGSPSRSAARSAARSDTVSDTASTN